MKKISLLLAVIMILGCFVTLVGCQDKGSSSEKSNRAKAQDCVEGQLMLETVMSTLGGSKITYRSCTFASVNEQSNGDFKISGKVKVSDEYGDIWVANYSAVAEYEEYRDNYDADVEIGKFTKQ